VPLYSKAALAGSWLLVHAGDADQTGSQGAAFELLLKEDGSFTSTRGMGTGSQLAGRWNTWDKDKQVVLQCNRYWPTVTVQLLFNAFVMAPSSSVEEQLAQCCCCYVSMLQR
jgi:hypothetical protein